MWYLGYTPLFTNEQKIVLNGAETVLDMENESDSWPCKGCKTTHPHPTERMDFIYEDKNLVHLDMCCLNSNPRLETAYLKCVECSCYAEMDECFSIHVLNQQAEAFVAVCSKECRKKVANGQRLHEQSRDEKSV